MLGEKNAKFLNSSWPAEFDKQKMVRATWMPLKIATKIYKKKEEIDVRGMEHGMEHA